jgi:hypothetical protein
MKIANLGTDFNLSREKTNALVGKYLPVTASSPKGFHASHVYITGTNHLLEVSMEIT